MTGRPFSEREIDVISALWAKHYTVNFIGALLDRTGNAIAGKVRRLGLPPHRVFRGAWLIHRRASNWDKKAVPPPPAVLQPQEPPPKRAPVIRRLCQWPVGEPKAADFHYCGAITLPGKSYCEQHCARAFLGQRGRVRAP